MSQMDKNKVCADPIENKQYDIDNGINGLDHLDEHDNDTIKYQLLHSGEPVTINAGGIKYCTSLSTLCSNTESIFYKCFNGDWSLRPCKDGSYFFDRNGELFKYILEYLRNNKLNIPDDTILINALICEAKYYQLTGLKSELLIQKTKSVVLKKSDIEFITKSFDETYKSFGKPFEISHTNLVYSYNGNNCIDYDDIYGSKRLLFLLCSNDNDRFGFYIHDKYDKQGEADGFAFDLCSKLTGEHCVRKKYMPWKPGDGVQFTIEESSTDIMFEAIILWNENDEHLQCAITKDDGSGFKCDCKWKQTDHDRTVFTKYIERLEIFRIL
eukprot:309698_1